MPGAAAGARANGDVVSGAASDQANGHHKEPLANGIPNGIEDELPPLVDANDWRPDPSTVPDPFISTFLECFEAAETAARDNPPDSIPAAGGGGG